MATNDYQRAQDYLTVLEIGLLNIRALADSGNAAQCFIEADHIHNIPQLLKEWNDGMAEYYWNVERVSYLAKSDYNYAARFEPVWRQMRK